MCLGVQTIENVCCAHIKNDKTVVFEFRNGNTTYKFDEIVNINRNLSSDLICVKTTESFSIINRTKITSITTLEHKITVDFNEHFATSFSFQSAQGVSDAMRYLHQFFPISPFKFQLIHIFHEVYIIFLLHYAIFSNVFILYDKIA